MSFKKSLINS
ncbi:UNVERIFIED_CONTAM: hypothetical protein GTU68_041020 [Idotea baltica]|nr:hypothetical protein [Idotea baltica]